MEVENYFKAIQCDVQSRKHPSGLWIAEYVLWPEVRSGIQLNNNYHYIYTAFLGNGVTNLQEV